MFRRIAVHLDHGADCQRRIDFCLRVAKAHDAHLTGIYASYVAPGYFYDEAGLWVRSMDKAVQINEKARSALQKSFSQAAEDAGVAASWRQGEAGTPAECAARHARCSDMLVVGQANPQDPEAATGNDFVEQVLLSAGRPVKTPLLHVMASARPARLGCARSRASRCPPGSPCAASWAASVMLTAMQARSPSLGKT